MIRIGCAGWSIPRESADNFPADGSHLQRYAAQLSAVEINSSFYRPHRWQTYARWAASVPADFRFSVKVPKLITHERRLRDSSSQVARFWEAAQALGDRLGCLLVQLPPSFVLEAAVAEAFFTHLRRLYSGPVVLEPRHASWCGADVERILCDLRVARVAADPTPIPCGGQPGGSAEIRYFRLHGTPRIYYSSYSDEFLKDLSANVTSGDRPEVPTWCIFDNTGAGFATANALRLQSLVIAGSAASNDSSNRETSAMAKKKAATKRAPKKAPKKGIKKGAKKKAAKRELIAPRGDKRFVRRDERGRIKESDDVGRSLSQDRRRTSKKAAKPGQGDKGDRKPTARRKK